MTDFVFTLRVKQPKPSSKHKGCEMTVIKSNVRIPDWVLTMIENSFKQLFIERLCANHVVIIHTRPLLWMNHGSKILEMLIDAPSNSRRYYPAQILMVERLTGATLDSREFPIWP